MDNKNIILRIKKTIYYTDKVLVNMPRNEQLLKTRISNYFYDILELSYIAIYDKNNLSNILKQVLSKIKMLDFFLTMSLDKNIISHKNIKTIGINLRDITELFYKWLNKYEKSK